MSIAFAVKVKAHEQEIAALRALVESLCKQVDALEQRVKEQEAKRKPRGNEA